MFEMWRDFAHNVKVIPRSHVNSCVHLGRVIVTYCVSGSSAGN